MRASRAMWTIVFCCFVALVVVTVAACLIARYVIWPPYWDSGYTEGVPALTEEFRDASGGAGGAAAIQLCLPIWWSLL